MESLRQDVRLAVRLLLKQPGFSLLAITTLALGIGLSTALFSVLDAAFIRPLPYPNPEQLVGVSVLHTGLDGEPSRYGPSAQDVEDFRAQRHVFSHVAMSRNAFSEPLILDGEEAQRLIAQHVSLDYFEMYGVSPFLGRAFNEDEVKPGGPDVVILGYGLWQTRFGGDRDIVGKTIRLNEQPTTVVGVLPAWFFPARKIWRPLPLTPQVRRGSGASVEGRLRPGLTLEQAETALTAMLAREEEAGGEPSGVKLTSMYESATAPNVKTARIISYAVAFVLLLACVNVAGLLLARGAARSPELAVRASLGAGRVRIMRQLLTESIVLALAGAALGIGLAWVSLDVLVANMPMSLPSNAPVVINLKALAFAAGAALATGVIFGLLPAIRLSRVRLGDALSRAGRRHGSALSRRGAQTLIAIEVSLAVVLLAGAGLMIRSFARLSNVDLGFSPDAIIGMEVAPAAPGRAAHAGYYPALLERLTAHPAVEAAGAVDYLPLIGGSAVTIAERADTPPRMGEQTATMNIRQYLGDYFAALDANVMEGTLPPAGAAARSVPLVVINQVARKSVFGDRPAVGQQIRIRGRDIVEVAAVIANFRHNGPLAGPRPELWSPFDSKDARGRALAVVVRPKQGQNFPPGLLREAAHAVGQRVVVERVARGSSWLSDRVVTPRRRTVLLSLLGGLGFLLALVGVFGMTAYAVARRTQEIGVRMAFGATPGNVVGVMVRDSVWPVVIGVVAGLVGSWWATKVIASFLFETEPRDIATLASVALVLAAAAGLAAWIPARRAARIDPIIALRAE